MKKSIAVLMFCSLSFWACDSSKTTEEANSSSTTTSNTTTAVANTATVKTAPSTELIASEEPSTGLGKFKFEERSFDFGDIKQGDVVEHAFTFTNVGEAPLTISNIKASCGCTTPSWPREPIAPGEEGEILVKFNSRGKMGQQNKSITISANVEGGTDRISIRTSIAANTEDTSDMIGPVKK